MSSEENAASVTFMEESLGTRKEENVPPLEADPQKATSEKEVPDDSYNSKPNIKQEGHDMGTPPTCHPEKRSSAPSELSATILNEPQIEQVVPNFSETENVTDQLFKGMLIDVPSKEIPGLGGMFTSPATSLAMEDFSEIKIRENAPPLEADQRIPALDIAMPGETSESKPNKKKEDRDLGTLLLCHPDKRSSAASELNATLHDNSHTKQEVPTYAEKKNATNQIFGGFQINLPKQDISGLEAMFTDPATSLAMESFSGTQLKEEKEVAIRLNHDLLPPLSQHLHVADNSVQHDQLQNNWDELPSATAPHLVQHELAMLFGPSDSEPDMQLGIVGYDSTSEDAMSEVGLCSSPVTSPPAEVLSEVDESPYVDENNLPDGSRKKLSYLQCPLHKPVGINYVRPEQSQSQWLNLPFNIPVPVQKNVIGCSSSMLHFHHLELLATPNDQYCTKSNLSNPGLPLTQQTSASASSSGFAKPSGRYASVCTNNTYQPPIFIPTGAHIAADTMPYSANGYNNNGSIPGITGHKRPREGKRNLADQIPSIGPITSALSASAYGQLTTHQVYGVQSRTPSVTLPIGISGSTVSFSNIEVNRGSQYSLHSPAPHIQPWFSLGQHTTSPTQIQRDPHLTIPNSLVAPPSVGTRAYRAPVPVPNALYNPSYEHLGLPVDPILRAFHQYNIDKKITLDDATSADAFSLQSIS